MAKKPNARKRRQAEKAEAMPVERRSVLRLMGFGVLGLAGFGGAGYAGYGMVQRHQAEHDLSRIGQGKPAVVQVHDPNCPTCTALQRETRRAMAQFGECDLIYLVADINQAAGQVFARRHNVPHVTLVLLDGQGRAVEVLSGMRSRAELRPLLAAHVESYGA
jgi:hypothetical protein